MFLRTERGQSSTYRRDRGVKNKGSREGSVSKGGPSLLYVSWKCIPDIDPPDDKGSSFQGERGGML